MKYPTRFTTARIWNGTAFHHGDLVFTDRILDEQSSSTIEIDLSGYQIFPGFINAHDHLELNHYPRTKFRDVYPNAHEWGEDVNRHLGESPFRELQTLPLWDRLFIGGLKNLLSGVITVVHHNPPHKILFHPDYPVRVIRKYAWSHSFHFNTDDEIIQTFNTKADEGLWFIHLAEGTDDTAKREYNQLSQLGLASDKTIIIHGVGISDAVIEDAVSRLGGLVWCPSTNLYLLGETIDISNWVSKEGGIALGSDSRLTADGDFLDEIRCASHFITAERVTKMVTSDAANLLNLTDTGHLQAGALADLVVLGVDIPLHHATRNDLALVIKSGVPQIGDEQFMKQFPDVPTVAVELDGVLKWMNIKLARLVEKCKVKEDGLQLLEKPPKRLFFF